QPHVHDVIGITWNRNAPAEGRAADREIAQASLYKGDNLVAPTVRPDEIGVGFIESQQAILPGRQTEEIGGLLNPLYFCAGRRDPAAILGDLELIFTIEGFIAHRIPAGILVQVDVP